MQTTKERCRKLPGPRWYRTVPWPFRPAQQFAFPRLVDKFTPSKLRLPEPVLYRTNRWNVGDHASVTRLFEPLHEGVKGRRLVAGGIDVVIDQARYSQQPKGVAPFWLTGLRKALPPTASSSAERLHVGVERITSNPKPDSISDLDAHAPRGGCAPERTPRQECRRQSARQ